MFKMSSTVGRSVPQSGTRTFLWVEVLEDRSLLSVCLVDRLTDLGQGSGLVGDLRYCITQAQNGDSIQFGVQGVINLTDALPDLTQSISIEGPGADLLTVRRDTGGDYRIFSVASGATVTLSGLTAANGFGTDGGGIANAGTLTLSGVTLSGNRARTAFFIGPAFGGGIYNTGVLTVRSSTLAGNVVAPGCFPCDGFGGGIYNTGTLTVGNSTLSGNSASGDWVNTRGGGIFNSSSATLTVTNSTLTGNTALSINVARGGGIANEGTLNLRNTILAGNNADQGPDLSGNLATSGYNLIGNTQGGSGFHPTDLLNVNPLLGPLQNNGGPTQTHALLPGSPAIDRGDPTLGSTLLSPKFDQRGEGFYRVVGGRVDIGSYEVQGRGGEPWTSGELGDRSDYSLMIEILSEETDLGKTEPSRIETPGGLTLGPPRDVTVPNELPPSEDDGGVRPSHGQPVPSEVLLTGEFLAGIQPVFVTVLFLS